MRVTEMLEPATTTPAPRILVVDDDDAIRRFLTDALIDEGYQVIAAPHGEAALALLGEQDADLVLLDMRMPVMDGATFITAYRQRPSPHAPIIAMAASTAGLAAAQSFDPAAALAKPFSLDDLLNLVGTIVPAHAN